MGAHYVRVSYWLNESPFLLLCVGQEAHSSLRFYGSLSRRPVATHVALGPQLMQSHTWGRISVSLSVVFSAAVFPSLTLSQPKQLYQESESKLPFSLSSIPRKESFLRMKLCLQIFARGIVAAHIIFFSLWNRKVREAHSLLLFAALPEASLEAASWLDPGTTVSHNISVFQKHRTEVLCVWALCSYPKSPCVIYKCLPSL